MVAMHVSFSAERVKPHNGRGRPISSVIADRESNPRRAAALARARGRLAQMMTGEDQTAHTLASLRLARGLSQSALADAIETQQSYIAKIEREPVELRSKTIRKLASALGVTCDQIIAAAEKNDPK